MRIVIVGGGMAGLALARSLGARGIVPIVLERMPAGARVPGPIMMPYQGYDALADAGVYDAVRARGHDIAPRPDGTPVAIAVSRQAVLDLLEDGVEVRRGEEVTDLMRDGDRVVGVRVRGSDGEREAPSELLVAADGTFSRVRELAGIEAKVRPSPGAGLSFRSSVRIDVPFAMAYQSDGRQVGLLGWPEGSAGWWKIDRIGRERPPSPLGSRPSSARSPGSCPPPRPRSRGSLPWTR